MPTSAGKKNDADNRAAGFGRDGNDDFWIDEGRPLVCLYVAVAALGLHAFPTRRSSDLRLARDEPGRAGSHPASAPTRLMSSSTQRAMRRSHPQARSEEHTSELQSRRELVCRPRLERKTTPTIAPPGSAATATTTSGSTRAARLFVCTWRLPPWVSTLSLHDALPI